MGKIKGVTLRKNRNLAPFKPNNSTENKGSVGFLGIFDGTLPTLKHFAIFALQNFYGHELY